MFDLKCEAVNNGDTWALKCDVTGPFHFNAVLNWDKLPAGDVKGPVSDDNPGGVMAALVGKLSKAMALAGVSDTNPSELVFEGKTDDPGVVCDFESFCLEAASECVQIGYRKANKHGSRAQFGRGRQFWNMAGYSKKGK